MAKRTMFLKQSEEQSTAPESEAMLALFAPRPEGAAEVKGLKMERRNMPQIVKAVQGNKVVIPVGGIVSGIILDVMPSQKADIKGSLLWLHIVQIVDGKIIPTGTEICFPACGSIRQALAPAAKGNDREKEEEAREIMLKYKGHLLMCKRQPDKINSKFHKKMGIWDVVTSDKPVDCGVKVH